MCYSYFELNYLQVKLIKLCSFVPNNLSDTLEKSVTT